MHTGWWGTCHRDRLGFQDLITAVLTELPIGVKQGTAKFTIMGRIHVLVTADKTHTLERILSAIRQSQLIIFVGF